jgi:hypothetical protein
MMMVGVAANRETSEVSKDFGSLTSVADAPGSAAVKVR